MSTSTWLFAGPATPFQPHRSAESMSFNGQNVTVFYSLQMLELAADGAF
jgi:hypothetical protein